MSTGYLYEPLPDIERGRRLHLNENAGGCSPAVVRAIRRLSRQDISAYPAYARATEACAGALSVPPDFVLLTNGLDEGIMTAALALIPRAGADAVVQLAAEMPDGGAVFVDEAYADFEGRTVIGAIARTPNLVVGRTFAKAYGLAGMRIGCLVAQPAIIRRLRGAIAPFSVNVFAAAALEAALADRGHVEWYLSQVRASRELLYDACTRLGLPFWRSAANFVLVRVGDAPGVRSALAARGVHVRDRSAAPGCDGCVRITAGLVDDTNAAIAALEEVTCAARR
jgi:histidinol-phosphate/aromatic aminotransferase/cobyric acid decarboxylase-like protein